jgi:hypothetical protein
VDAILEATIQVLLNVGKERSVSFPSMLKTEAPLALLCKASAL